MNDGVCTIDNGGIDVAAGRVPSRLTRFGGATHQSHHVVAVSNELRHESRANEPAGTRDDDSHVVRLRPNRLPKITQLSN